jgi:hypothetical protein
MPISKKQLIANCKNAQKSTGPKTPLGKLRSSGNAYKHGLYAKMTLKFALERLSTSDRSLFMEILLKEMKGQNKKTNPFLLNHSWIITYQFPKWLRFIRRWLNLLAPTYKKILKWI